MKSQRGENKRKKKEQLKGLILNVPTSHNVSFEKMKFKVFKTLANQINDGKNLNGFLLYWLCIPPYFNNFLEFYYDIIRN